MAVLFGKKGLNATLVQVTSGCTNFKGVTVLNNSGAACFVQFFNALAANVTLGTTVPDYEVFCPNATTVAISEPPEGNIFPTGLCMASTTADGGAGGSAAGVNVYVKI